jgi:hypothetical protein
VTFEELQVVVLDRDLPEHGLRKGDVGTIVYVNQPDAVQVEFIAASGDTVALVTLSGTDLRKANSSDMMTVRNRKPVTGSDG